MHCLATSPDDGTPCTYRRIEGVERLERYKPGGYHPILLGDILHGRYEVVQKLGFGTYSTVWLTYDQKRSAYVAIKVCTADAPLQEVEILRTLTKNQTNHPGLPILPVILDDFELQGPNGRHQCYVTRTARSSVAGAKYSCCFEISVARALVAQLILAVDYIHSHGYVHSDIHLGNILFRLSSSYDQFSPKQLCKQFGEPRTESLIRLDGKRLPPNAPIYGVIPAWLGKHADQVRPCEAHVLLGDFGEAFNAKTEKRYGNDCHVPLPILPPEVIFEPEKSLSFSSDVWALACATWSIFGMRSLFDGTLATQDDIASQQIDTLGISSLPCKWWTEWAARHQYFEETGQPHGNRTVFPPLEQSFEEEIQTVRREEGVEEFGEEEKAAVIAMFRSMLVFQPEKRASAKLVMASKWMMDWGLPALKCLRRD
ncbi:hypothetical protein MferCBS31731_001712 [Microsporum ferrugineum]